MIPIKLELTNFLSYRETAVLDFAAIHLACISGPNGAGKSSLLDAMTWALFGKSRSRSDDDVVNRLAALNGEGADVQFTFRLENNEYRIIRRKKRGKTSQLELQMDAGDEWKSLSESKIRETQAAIEELLRMNYDTFTNASFLLQGQADEFTTKTPGKRKEILADLLRVNQWDQYRDAAAERRKIEEENLALLDGQLVEIDNELAQEEERRAALETAQAELDAVKERLQLKEQLLNQMRQTATAVKQQKEMVTNLDNSLVRAQNTQIEWEKDRAQRQAERDAYQAILDDADAITAAYAARQEAEANLQAWQKKADEYNRLQQAQRPFELTVTQEKSRLTQRRQELQAQSERVAAAQEERETVQQKLEQAKARLDELNAALADLSQQEKAWQAARDALQKMESERKLLAQQAEQLQTQAKRIQKLQKEETAARQNHSAAQSALDDANTQIAALTAQRQQHATALADKNSLETEQPRLKADMNKLKERIDRLSAESGNACPLCGQPLSPDHRRTVLAELKQEGSEKGDRYRANQERIQTLTATVAELNQALKQQPRLEREQQAQQQRLAQAEARLHEIEQAVAEWEADGAPRLADLRQKLADDAALKAQAAKVAELNETVQAKSSLEKERETVRRQISQAEARLTEIDRAAAEWETSGQTALAEVTAQLESGDYAAEAQASLAELEEAITAVAYDEAAHQQAKEAHAALNDAPQRHQKLQQAQAAVKPLDDALADLDKRLAEQQKTVAELKEQKETAVAQLEQLTDDAGDLHTVEDEVLTLREAQSDANRKVGAAQQKLSVLADLRQRKEALTAERAQFTQHIQRLRLLEKACGRDGVQALLIEQALPDIEDRANTLLERLTGGEMRVMFETQRQLKTRDALAETLDIRIIDGAGERPYENFSGGEQFRVNFAIRLALSQILAKRSGARLQTLVIDEGFGSQDPNGRQRLVEAINTIQEDFARILVITHIDELRDAFPSRIEVQKTITGSTVTVI